VKAALVDLNFDPDHPFDPDELADLTWRPAPTTIAIKVQS